MTAHNATHNNERNNNGWGKSPWQRVCVKTEMKSKPCKCGGVMVKLEHPCVMYSEETRILLCVQDCKK